MGRAVGRIFEVVIDFMNVAVGIVRKPPANIIAVDFPDVFVVGVASAVDDYAHILLRRELQAHLRIEPV